jgi:hypothetical protein
VPGGGSGRRRARCGRGQRAPERKAARPADYETWTEDIERAVVCVSRQDFPFASTLLNRWLGSHDPHDLDDKGLYLYGRSLVLLGDVQRDQGAILGPLSARQSYLTARGMFSELDIPRRLAQIELSLAVVQEMSGQLDASARSYEQLAGDERLSRRDRARARLWIGTALSKEGNNAYATTVMAAATREFEELGEPEDWSVAHQKLALAHRGAGKLTQALHYIDIAHTTGTVESPMQRGNGSRAGRRRLPARRPGHTSAPSETNVPWPPDGPSPAPKRARPEDPAQPARNPSSGPHQAVRLMPGLMQPVREVLPLVQRMGWGGH